MKLQDAVKYISITKDIYGVDSTTTSDVKVFVDSIIDARYYSKAGGLVSRTMVFITKSDATALKCKPGDMVEIPNFEGVPIKYAVQKITNNKNYVGLVV